MSRRLVAVTLFAASLLSAAPQTQFPDTPAAHQFAAWLEAFNSGDRAKLLGFLQKNNPARAGQIDQEMGFRRMTGGFDFKKTEESAATRFAGVVREHDSDSFARFVLEVESAESLHISQFDLRLIPTPAEFAVPRLTEDCALAALRNELDKSAKPIFTGAYGLADREKKVPNKLDTQVRIGSMNKMFTAVAVLQLAQVGKIKLSDPLGKYLSDYPNKELASKVTIHHLLTHTGGTGDFFGPEFDKHQLELRSLFTVLRTAKTGTSAVCLPESLTIRFRH